MSQPPSESATTLAGKIARLVEERGWNQEDFARITQLNRQTVRQILIQNGQRRLQNATVSACARALGLSVSELRDRPLEQLLIRMNRRRPGDAPFGPGDCDEQVRRLYEQAAQPELQAWIEAHPERARHFTGEEIDELLSPTPSPARSTWRCSKNSSACFMKKCNPTPIGVERSVVFVEPTK